MIKVSGLSRTYGDYRAVDDVSFEIPQGQIVGLLGPNGAGKTTLMKILTGYHYADSGQARIDGLDVGEDLQEVQKRVGYLPESAPVYQDLTVREYLTFMGRIREVPDLDKAIARVVAQCALEGVEYKSIAHLSKGYRQRVGLAQAIIHDPKVLILDEPTTGLDPNQILEFRNLIRELGKEKTVILSTHIMQEVEAICQRVLILNKGKIQADGRADEIAKELKGSSVVYTMKVRGLTGKEGLKALAGLKDCDGPADLSQDGPDPVFRLSFPSGVEGGERLFDWAVEHKIKILSLIPETLTLEDVFAELTKEESHEGNA